MTFSADWRETIYAVRRAPPPAGEATTTHAETWPPPSTELRVDGIGWVRRKRSASERTASPWLPRQRTSSPCEKKPPFAGCSHTVADANSHCGEEPHPPLLRAPFACPGTPSPFECCGAANPGVLLYPLGRSRDWMGCEVPGVSVPAVHPLKSCTPTAKASWLERISPSPSLQPLRRTGVLEGGEPVHLPPHPDQCHDTGALGRGHHCDDEVATPPHPLEQRSNDTPQMEACCSLPHWRTEKKEWQRLWHCHWIQCHWRSLTWRERPSSCWTPAKVGSLKSVAVTEEGAGERAQCQTRSRLVALETRPASE